MCRCNAEIPEVGDLFAKGAGSVSAESAIHSEADVCRMTAAGQKRKYDRNADCVHRVRTDGIQRELHVSERRHALVLFADKGEPKADRSNYSGETCAGYNRVDKGYRRNKCHPTPFLAHEDRRRYGPDNGNSGT